MTDFNNYYMLVALAVREKANCIGRKVGAIIVKENRIIGTGYNGTPEGMANCENEGCMRCTKYRNSGELYDKCICVHAEQNAMITAARFGHSIDGSIVYTTLEPCFTCCKEFLQAKIETFYYLEKLNIVSDEHSLEEKDKDFDSQYEILLNRFKKMPTQLEKPALEGSIQKMKEYLSVLN